MLPFLLLFGLIPKIEDENVVMLNFGLMAKSDSENAAIISILCICDI